MRKGMATGQGKGYRNIVGRDSGVHRDSSKGIKQPQRINTFTVPNPNHTEALKDYDDYLKKVKKKRINSKIINVDSVPKDYQFVSDSQDVEAIKENLGKKAEGFDSFFVKVGEGDYDGVYGMEGTVPYTNKTVEKLR
jgi:hypothetical protein